MNSKFKEGGTLNAGRCEGCGHHVIVGHVVTLYHDVGEVHLDCENPYDLPTTEAAGTQDDPKVYVLLGDPVQNYPAPLSTRRPAIEISVDSPTSLQHDKRKYTP